MQGVIPVMPAPFRADESLDLAAVPRLVDYGVACGVKFLCLPAYGSEYYKMTDEERIELIRAAASAAAGRLVIVGQSNHGSAKVAARLARAAQDAGAGVISLALPRLFPLTEDDLLRYAAVVCEAVTVPVMLQDFNPGGPTVGPDFCVAMHRRCPNFQYLKLEHARMGSQMEAIHAATAGRVGVLEGWGGLFMPELVPRGVVGSVPGFGLADVFVRVFDELRDGDRVAGFRLFSEVVPYLEFSLANFEVFHHLEKRLLMARGAMTSTVVRDFTALPDDADLVYFEWLLERLWETLDRWGFARQPAG